ncbi:MAG: tripartite tricarboxylate transporter substrate binding protein [Proteobacteria bacterium]|nr:tripartite tricarboxylate transporter substrate binding protein [Pseudomonadota bacterium]
MKTVLRALLVAALALPGAAFAQAYPAKPVKLVVGFTPGGGVDINARLLAARLSDLLGQQVIVENKPGAGTNIANEYVAHSAPDGYTLLMNTAAVAINMSLYKRPGYDALKDFAGVSVFSSSPNVLVVNASTPVKSVADLIALARAEPGKLNYSSAGSGTTQHLSGELFKTLTKTDIVHVPYKGTSPALTALIAGEVQLSYANIPAIQAHVKSGRLRPLASTGPKRAELMPDVPTMREAGVDMDVVVWYGVLAPAATPRDIVNRLAEAVAKAAHSPETRQRLLEQGAEPLGSTPEDFDRQLKREVATWAAVVKASGAKVND